MPPAVYAVTFDMRDGAHSGQVEVSDYHRDRQWAARFQRLVPLLFVHEPGDCTTLHRHQTGTAALVPEHTEAPSGETGSGERCAQRRQRETVFGHWTCLVGIFRHRHRVVSVTTEVDRCP